jgi:hypothetical protein
VLDRRRELRKRPESRAAKSVRAKAYEARHPEVRLAWKASHRNECAERERRRLQTVEGRANLAERIRRYRERAASQPKELARKALARAVRLGQIVRPEVCAACSERPRKKLDAHHPDYGKPLEVVWLCRRCHVEAHWGRAQSA